MSTSKLVKHLLFVIPCFILSNGFSQNFDAPVLLQDQAYGTGYQRILDANGDGLDDLLSYPYLTLNDGSGKRGSTQKINNNRKDIADCATGDLDGNGTDELVVLYQTGKIEVYRYQKGSFNIIEQGNPIYHSYDEYADIFIADIDGDKQLDIIVEALRGSNKVFIGQGDLQFEKSTLFTEQFGRGYRFILVDVDSDGSSEFLVHHRKNTTGNATGILKTLKFDGTKIYVSDSIICSPRIFRLNYAKSTDLQGTGKESLIVQANVGGEQNGAVFYQIRLQQGKMVSIKTLTAVDRVDGLSLVDINKDGLQDILYYTGGQFSKYFFGINRGADGFLMEQKSELPLMGDVSGIRSANLNNDDKQDFWVNSGSWGSRQLYSMVSSGDTYLINHWLAKPSCGAFTSSDLDSNGIVDFLGVTGQSLFNLTPNNEGKHISQLMDVKLPERLEHIHFFDANDDNHKDVLFANHNGVIHFVKYDNGYSNLSVVKFQALGNNLRKISSIDMDDDGDLDIIAYYVSKKMSLVMYKNNGQSGFETTPKVLLESSDFLQIEVGDINQDGQDEVLNLEKGTYIVNKNGSYTEEPMGIPISKMNGIFNADIDGDKHPDMIVSTFKNLHWLEKVNNVWIDSIIGSGSHSLDIVGVEDLDNDGLDEIVAISESSDIVFDIDSDDPLFSSNYSLVTLKHSNGKFIEKGVAPLGSPGHVHITDVDNDEDLDILISGYHYPNGGISLFRNSHFSKK